MKFPWSRYAKTFLLAVFFVHISCQKPTSQRLEYEIINSQVDSLPALEVRMQFSPGSGEVTYVRYDDEAWGQAGLFNCLREVRLVGGGGSLLVEPDSSRIRIEHPEGAGTMVLSYKIVQDTPGPLDAHTTYRPIIDPSYFHVFAHNLFALPEHYWQGESPAAEIILTWTGWEPEEVIHNSFGSKERRQELGVVPLEKFHSAIFVGGDFRVYTDRIQGNQLHLALRGDWIPFGDAEVMELLGETVRAQRDFWKDHSQAYFTVTMRPFPQERGSSFQGTGLTNSFATSVSNNDETEIDQLAYLFNHELMHNWIGSAIENADEEAQYWFSEGFTEYYTAKNIATYGIGGRDWGYFIDNLNETIRLLGASAAKEAPNSEITYENFWKDPEYGKLPYRRGMLFACYLDLQLQAVSGGKYSLDDVMRDLFQASREEGQKLTHAHFLNTVNTYLPEDLTPFFNRHIVRGEALPLEELFGQLGFDLEQEAGLFDLGFDFSPEKTEVEAVDPASEAFSAGVREGDRVVSRNIYLGNTQKQVELLLERDGQRIPVSYYPLKKVPLVQLQDNEANRARFRK
ncbi:MAG: M1 family aminopeptidase [Robiginitalea sp.]|nr:M1 family aminopeptidase [Robiginitalea sp.]